METSGIRATTTKNTGAPPPASSSQPPPPLSGAAKEFDTTLRGVIRSEQADSVSEEDLFAAVVMERVKSLKDEKTFGELKKLMEQTQSELKKADGYIPMEDAAKGALVKLRDTGAITATEADTIYAQAFAAAQLDQNTEALYDARGGKNDPTRAVATLEQALLKSRVVIEEFTAGTKQAAPRSLLESSTGRTAQASGGTTDAGFLFKPVSDSDKKLAVLLPPRLTGLATGVRLVGPDGDILETGRYTGNGNGGREHFRFNKPGGDYPDGLTVEVLLRTGEVVRYLIEESSERNEGGSSNGSSASAATPSSSDGSRTAPSRSSRAGSTSDTKAQPDL